MEPSYPARKATIRTIAKAPECCDVRQKQAIRSKWAENLGKVTHGGMPADLELKSLKRTRSVLVWQKWLFGYGIFFTASALAMQFEIRNGRIEEFHLLLGDSPIAMGSCALIAVACWAGFWRLRTSLR